MANIALTKGENYRFARVGGNTIIDESSDHAHAPMYFRNQLRITGSNGGSPKLWIHQEGSSDVGCQIVAKNGSGPNLRIQQVDFDRAAYIHILAGGIPFSVGGSNIASSANLRDFIISRSSTLFIGSGGSHRYSTSNKMCMGRSTSETTVVTSNPTTYGNGWWVPRMNFGPSSSGVSLYYNTTTREIFYDSSTQKMKKNIHAPSASLYDKVLELQPRLYETKASGSTNVSCSCTLGFIAEEVGAVDPHFAIYGEDIEYNDEGSKVEDVSGSQNLLSPGLVPVNINDRAVISALVGKIQDLEFRLQQLENP